MNIVLEDKLTVEGIYDSRSRVSLINRRLIKTLKDNKDMNKIQLKTISGVSLTKGLTKIKIKMFDIEKKVDIFIVENEDFHDFLIGLDIIK